MRKATVVLMLLSLLVITPIPAKDTPTTRLSSNGVEARAAPSAKLIALTFDDGPKPYVLMGTPTREGSFSGAYSIYWISKRLRPRSLSWVGGFRKMLTRNAARTTVGFAARRPRKSTGAATRLRTTLSATATSASW